MPLEPGKVKSATWRTVLFDNPIITLECRRWMRGWRVPVMVFGFTSIFIAVYIYRFITEDSCHMVASEVVELLVDIGQMSTTHMIIMLTVASLLVAPIITAGAFTREKEQHTLEPLLISNFSNSEILIGKLFPTIILLLIIIACFLPALIIAIVFGGLIIDLKTLLFGFILLFSIVAQWGIVGMTVSLISKSTVVARAQSLLICFIVIPIGWLLLARVLNFDNDNNLPFNYCMLALLFVSILHSIVNWHHRKTLYRWKSLLLLAGTIFRCSIFLTYSLIVLSIISHSEMLLIVCFVIAQWLVSGFVFWHSLLKLARLRNMKARI